MKTYQQQLDELKSQGCLRTLPQIQHQGKYIWKEKKQMLNLSSNDYLGLANDMDLRNEFLDKLRETHCPLSSTSSRLLTGNFTEYFRLEEFLAEQFQKEAALLFNSGYHANTGILPALANKQTLILTDRLVHASIIDGIRLSNAPFERYKHNDYEHLERLLHKTQGQYEQTIIVTESIFSMDGDVANLPLLAELKKKYSNILLYVDEAHAIGARGNQGLGIAEEQECIQEIDLLVGTFGKALASMGAYLLCSQTIREYLINTMRPLIFSTALPPMQIAWTHFLFERLHTFQKKREHLSQISALLRSVLKEKGGDISASHIIPCIEGTNETCILQAEELQRKGFYCLPVRPPTVPKGTARIRFSLTAEISLAEINELISLLTKEI